MNHPNVIGPGSVNTGGYMLLPVLKPATWDGLRNGARVHLWIGTPTEPVVVVAYGRQRGDGGDELDYVSASHPDADSDDLVREAFNNLEYYHTDFEVVEANGGRMLVSAGWPFAAERALCQSHMLLAHEKLDAEQIVVSITRRGSLLACAHDGNDAVRHSMSTLHSESYADAVTTGEEIFGNLILVRDGCKTGILSVT